MQSSTRVRFIKELHHHLQGWKTKVLNDFSDESFALALKALQHDEVYAQFHLATEEYVLIRLMGRISISIGRRLGEIYDKIPRLLVQARFNLGASDVALKFAALNLDIGIPSDKLVEQDRGHVAAIISRYLGGIGLGRTGLGIEIRYNFNPADSSRLRKDCQMAEYLHESGYLPVYLVFSSISPRDEAIERLKRAGWRFIVGQEAIMFMRELCEMDFKQILEDPTVSAEVLASVDEIMKSIYASSHVQRVASKHSPRSTLAEKP